MAALEFQSSLNPNGTLSIPQDMANRLKNIPSFQVVVLVPQDNESKEDDEAWRQLGLTQFLKGYADSDSVYDDL